jgi:hypothetical protein
MDFRIMDHGSIKLLFPDSDAAKAWVAENVAEDHQTYAGGIVVEPRYIEDLTIGLLDAGMTGTLDGHALSVVNGEVMRAA